MINNYNKNLAHRSISILTLALLAFLVLGCEKEDNNEESDENLDPSILVDIEGNRYNTVEILGQIWMAENLRATKLNDGTDILNITNTLGWADTEMPAYTWYNHDDETYREQYGALYNWFVVGTGKLCPEGWHVPTMEEWVNLGNSLIMGGFNYDDRLTGNRIGKALASATGWKESNVTGAIGNSDYPEKVNATGLNIFPAGARDWEGAFYGIGSVAGIWTGTESTLIYLLSGDVSLRITTYASTYGYSVRCVKNDNIN